jgi:predicted DNA-binding helix-hairpin-helix protein
LLFIDQVRVQNDGMIPRFFLVTGMAMLALALNQTVRSAEPVDLNRATMAELMRVPGMTTVWAVRVVRFRPYWTKLDLVEQGVVTPEVYRRIRANVIAHRIATSK